MTQPTTRPITEQELARLKSFSATNESVRVLSFNDRPETIFNPCACIGPINCNPYCPCIMKQNGLTSIPTLVDVDKLNVALCKVFNW